MIGKKKVEEQKNRYEECVCCKKKTDVPCEMRIEKRRYYIEGAGQLCYECYKDIYK